MATLEQLQNALVQADAAGNVEDAKAFASAIRDLKTQAQVQADRQLYDPTKGMSTFDKAMAGAGKAVADTGLGLRQLGARVFGSPEDVKRLQGEVAESRRLDSPLMSTGAGVTGNVGGNIAMALLPGGVVRGAGTALSAVPRAAQLAQALQAGGTAMMAPTSITGAGALGAVQGALQPSVSDSETMKNIGMGAGAGAGGATIGRLLSPSVRPEVRTLMDEGVSPTIGQIAGGRVQALEDKLTSVPILGDAITSARRGAVEDLNRAVYNRALNPIGAKSSAPVGRQGVADVSSKLGDAYADVLPRVQFTPDQQYVQDLAAVLNRGSQVLPDAQNAQLGRIADAQLIGKVNGPMTGVDLKPIQSELNTIARGMRGDSSYDTRTLGGLVNDLNQTTRDAVIRSTPDEAALLRNIDQGYGQYATLRDAAARTGSKNGVFSPEALQGAVRAGDKSVGKGNFARGTANMQDLSDAAVNVLGRGYPDSGTAGRLLLSGGALGGLGTAVAAGLPGAVPVAAGLGAASLPYLPFARQMAAALLAGNRAPAVEAASPYVRSLAIGGAPSLPLLVNAPQQ